MKIEELTLEVLAERALTEFDSKKLVNWAVEAIELGYENDNLFILAGLDFDTTEEREHYFWKIVKDLKLEIEESRDELLNRYALTIADKAIRNDISIEYAFSQMLKIASISEYDYRYMVFCEIDEDLDYLTYHNTIPFHDGLTLENSKDFILEEMKLFIEMENLKIPIKERIKSYCENCKKLNTQKTKTKYQLKKPYQYCVWSCGLCGSEKLKHNSSHEVKRIIIEEFKKQLLT